mmetsp:Transcript_17635/g.42771  ORF Transcript_17635/g.42771 Transcript_17635/m.42771 type:complete len:205 (-) Transcript_17635:5293-5907(-)
MAMALRQALEIPEHKLCHLGSRQRDSNSSVVLDPSLLALGIAPGQRQENDVVLGALKPVHGKHFHLLESCCCVILDHPVSEIIEGALNTAFPQSAFNVGDLSFVHGKHCDASRVDSLSQKPLNNADKHSCLPRVVKAARTAVVHFLCLLQRMVDEMQGRLLLTAAEHLATSRKDRTSLLQVLRHGAICVQCSLIKRPLRIVLTD